MSLLSYLTFAIAEEEAVMRSSGRDPVMMPSTWLQVLQVVYRGVYAEFETRFERLLEPLLLLVVRIDYEIIVFSHKLINFLCTKYTNYVEISRSRIARKYFQAFSKHYCDLGLALLARPSCKYDRIGQGGPRKGSRRGCSSKRPLTGIVHQDPSFGRICRGTFEYI